MFTAAQARTLRKMNGEALPYYAVLVVRYFLVIAIVHVLPHASLIHVSGAAARPRVQVTYRLNDVDNENELECYNDGGFIQHGATFTFRNPRSPEQDYRRVIAIGRSYDFTIHPSNESLVSCTIDFQESNRVMVAGMHEHCTLSNTRHYVKSIISPLNCSHPSVLC